MGDWLSAVIAVGLWSVTMLFAGFVIGKAHMDDLDDIDEGKNNRN